MDRRKKKKKEKKKKKREREKRRKRKKKKKTQSNAKTSILLFVAASSKKRGNSHSSNRRHCFEAMLGSESITGPISFYLTSNLQHNCTSFIALTSLPASLPASLPCFPLRLFFSADASTMLAGTEEAVYLHGSKLLRLLSL